MFSGDRTYCKVTGAGPDLTKDRSKSDILQDGHPSGAGGDGGGEGNKHIHPVSGTLSSIPVEEQA